MAILKFNTSMDFVTLTKRSARLMGVRPDLTLREASEIINHLSKRRHRRRNISENFDMETTAALVPLPANQRFVTEDEVTNEIVNKDKEEIGK